MTRLRHVTPGEKIRALLEEREQRGEQPFNITQLAKAMGKARESVSRRVNDKIGMAGEYPELFADALGISPEELQPPAVEAVSLASLDRRLQSLATQVERAVTLMEEALQLLRAAPPRAVQGGRRR